jgi:hypothetical protein
MPFLVAAGDQPAVTNTNAQAAFVMSMEPCAAWRLRRFEKKKSFFAAKKILSSLEAEAEGTSTPRHATAGRLPAPPADQQFKASTFYLYSLFTIRHSPTSDKNDKRQGKRKNFKTAFYLLFLFLFFLIL